MRKISILLFLSSFSICLAQTDSMFVEMTNGSIRGYPISSIKLITFSGLPTSVKEQEIFQNVLASFVLYQNYPNPFNPSTTIQYNIPKSGEVEVKIFDVQGRLIRSLGKTYRQAGIHSFIWDSRVNSGVIAASGTYFCHVLFNGSSLVKKLLLIK
jgi:hypothetical protein